MQPKYQRIDVIKNEQIWNLKMLGNMTKLWGFTSMQKYELPYLKLGNDSHHCTPNLSK